MHNGSLGELHGQPCYLSYSLEKLDKVPVYGVCVNTCVRIYVHVCMKVCMCMHILGLLMYGGKRIGGKSSS